MESDFKFYHGTSTIFLQSIRRYGLGKINPSIDYKNLEVLEFLYEKAEENLLHVAEYEVIRKPVTATVYQTNLQLLHEDGRVENLNYRHDGIYVALSRERAALHACLNKLGSEVLEFIVTLLKLLRSNNINVSLPESINLFKVENYIHMNPKPIIVEVLKISEDDLEKEDGKTAVEALDFLRRTMPKLSKKQQFEFLQYCNFKLLKPVEPENLKFYEVESEGHPKKNNFFFTLSQI